MSIISDYRRQPRALSHVYYSPISPENSREVEKIFKSLTSQNPDDVLKHNRKLNTWGRTIIVPESTSRIAKFDFNDLCGQPLSAADYIEVTKNFGTLFVMNIPKMGMNQKDLVRHFLIFLLPSLVFWTKYFRCIGEKIHYIYRRFVCSLTLVVYSPANFFFT